MSRSWHTETFIPVIRKKVTYAKFRRLLLMQNNKLERSNNQTPDLKLRYPFLRFLTYFFTTLCHGRYLLDSLQKLIRINRCYVHSVISTDSTGWTKKLEKTPDETYVFLWIIVHIINVDISYYVLGKRAEWDRKRERNSETICLWSGGIPQKIFPTFFMSTWQTKTGEKRAAGWAGLAVLSYR